MYIRSPVVSSRSESSVPHRTRTGRHIAPWWCTSSFSLLGWHDRFQTASRDRMAPNSTNNTLEIFKAKAKGKKNLILKGTTSIESPKQQEIWIESKTTRTSILNPEKILTRKNDLRTWKNLKIFLTINSKISNLYISYKSKELLSIDRTSCNHWFLTNKTIKKPIWLNHSNDKMSNVN